MWKHIPKAFQRNWKAVVRVIANKAPEWALLGTFLTLTIGALIFPLWQHEFAAPQYEHGLSAALSIGTGGLTSLVFYYVMTERVERRRRRLLRDGLKSTYSEAKRNIAFAVVHASQKGGRKDLQADSATVDLALTIEGFRAMFEDGSQADEGFYAFQNEMSYRTPEYEEIVFNLKIISRALERIVDSHRLDDVQTYNFFVRSSAFIARIERYGAGYDESKPLCSLIWEMFAGWNFIDGKLGYDPIERAISRL
ncbi:hypothetical protein [uncultured Brevundimonas sp.]|uniref:hypothetical protein n=1 Tax=uncultured Brevundimonas sp. TaxID=213418 RepID=UPI0030EBC370|tara:strand:- start:391 stop:1146 length:756 start_codon:yes stop_codon:yes gene_type:complete